MNKYFGKLAYIGAGVYGTIVRYDYTECPGGIEEFWRIRPVGRKDKDSVVVSKKPLILNTVKFTRIDNTIFCAVKIGNVTLPGYAICSPSDKDNGRFGKKLAVARALGDASEVLDEDFDNDYFEEYGESGEDENADDNIFVDEGDDLVEDEDNGDESPIVSE